MAVDTLVIRTAFLKHFFNLKLQICDSYWTFSPENTGTVAERQRGAFVFDLYGCLTEKLSRCQNFICSFKLSWRGFTTFISLIHSDFWFLGKFTNNRWNRRAEENTPSSLMTLGGYTHALLKDAEQSVCVSRVFIYSEALLLIIWRYLEQRI